MKGKKKRTRSNSDKNDSTIDNCNKKIRKEYNDECFACKQ